MKAALYEQFRGPIAVTAVADPTPTDDEVVVQVLAVGLCRSDYHGWHGTDPDIVCPHVGGHEFVGRVVAVGSAVTRLSIGDRVVAPFVEHLLAQNLPQEARRALDRARGALRPEPGSMLDREFTTVAVTLR